MEGKGSRGERRNGEKEGKVRGKEREEERVKEFSRTLQLQNLYTSCHTQLCHTCVSYSLTHTLSL